VCSGRAEPEASIQKILAGVSCSVSGNKFSCQAVPVKKN